MVEFQETDSRRPEGEICLKLGATTVSPKGLLSYSQVEACRGLAWGDEIKSVLHYVPKNPTPTPPPPPSLSVTWLISVRCSREKVWGWEDPGSSDGNWPQGGL